jgi:hypothetical protein
MYSMVGFAAELSSESKAAGSSTCSISAIVGRAGPTYGVHYVGGHVRVGASCRVVTEQSPAVVAPRGVY